MQRRWLTLTPDHRFVGIATAIATVVLFGYSSLRHFLLRSTAYDLGFFDNILYRLSQGQPPIDTLHNTHILGDHAAWILYPIALLYWITPNVHWLFGLQALALALGALPVYWLAKKHYGLTSLDCRILVLAYLLYPVVFNINLFDFHPDVFAPLLLLTAITMVYRHCLWGFVVALVLLCGCKGVFGLPIAGLGVWLVLGERRYRYGVIALVMGLGWFAIAQYSIIPTFWTGPEKGVGRYTYLGSSLTEVIFNLFLKPHVVAQHLLTGANLQYLVMLFLPLLWGLSWRSLTPLIGALPNLMLNLLSTIETQKDLDHQYSLPILPFAILALALALQRRQTRLRRPRWIITWMVVMFLVLARVEYFAVRYFDEGLRTVAASRAALSLMHPSHPVLVPSHIVPQVTHRPKVQMLTWGADQIELTPFANVFLDTEVPALHTQPETVPNLLKRLHNEPEFRLVFERNNVFLFERRSQSE
ncbi:MAG: DUF2079 domain-containing protein [Cyanobacteria bacterium P01_G01_bin.54]